MSERVDACVCPVCWMEWDQPLRKPGQRCGAHSTGCVGRVMLVKLAKKAEWRPRLEWAGRARKVKK